MYYTNIISKLPSYVLYTVIVSTLPKYANGYRSMLIKYVYSVLGFPANEKMWKNEKKFALFSRNFVFFRENERSKKNFFLAKMRIFAKRIFFLAENPTFYNIQ